MMVRSRPPKKLRKVCRMIFRMVEKNEKKVFALKPQQPRGIIALIFEGSKLFVLHAGATSPLSYTDFLQYQALKDAVELCMPNHEAPHTTYIS